MSKVAPCLWFDGQAEEAAAFYTSIFQNSRIVSTVPYPGAGYEIHKHPAGSVMLVEFELDGQRFTALNGGPHFKFNEAISLEVRCRTQEEVDYFWERLGEGGDESAQQCGWLKDKYGVSWQIVPTILAEMSNDSDRAKYERVMEAVLAMKKLDIEAIKRAYDG